MPQAKMNGTLYQLSDETIPADDVKKFQLQNKVRWNKNAVAKSPVTFKKQADFAKKAGNLYKGFCCQNSGVSTVISMPQEKINGTLYQLSHATSCRRCQQTFKVWKKVDQKLAIANKWGCRKGRKAAVSHRKGRRAAAASRYKAAQNQKFPEWNEAANSNAVKQGFSRPQAQQAPLGQKGQGKIPEKIRHRPSQSPRRFNHRSR
jgi:hypothetical protein